MQTTNQNLDSDLPREPKDQLDFLFLVGFIQWFDAPFLTGFVILPVGLFAWWYQGHDLVKPLLASILVYQVWLCILAFRTMHFVIKCIGSVKNVSHDAGRIAVSYLTGAKK
jgi:hypothetical protein